MAEGGEKKKGFSRGWSIFRWPLMLGALILSAVIFMIGLACSVGYTGTTPLKAMDISKNPDKASWDTLSGMCSASNQGSSSGVGSSTGTGPGSASLTANNKGKPYPSDFITSVVTAKKSGNILSFDRRIVRELQYIGKGLNPQCGWNETIDMRHDRIVLASDPFSNPSYKSDLSNNPVTNVASSSTLSRGTGVRVTQAGYIRCSWKSNGDELCPPPMPWLRHSRHEIVFDNNLFYSRFEKYMPEFNPVLAACVDKVVCAVDYYPNMAQTCEEESSCAASESAKEKDNPVVKNVDPGSTQCDPACQTVLPSFAKKAAAYKISQIALQLLMTDKAGCENTSGNVGINKNIPTSIILAQWAAEEINSADVWKKFLELANSVFPYNLQTESPLAGLSFDSKLNGKAGLHFNY